MKKPEFHALCKELEAELTDWKYLKTKNSFVNKSHKFVELYINYAWYSPYAGTMTSQLSCRLTVPEIAKTFKKYTGFDYSPFFYASLSDFSPLTISTYYIKSPEEMFTENDDATMSDEFAPQFIRDGFNYGDALFTELYDFSSYENFIKNIPIDFNWQGWDWENHPWETLSPEEKKYQRTQEIFLEREDFIFLSLLRMKIGDFDFIHTYEESKNIIVMDIKENYDLIVKAIPEIKDTWERTGNLI